MSSHVDRHALFIRAALWLSRASDVVFLPCL
jgi:hypothetical protein